MSVRFALKLFLYFGILLVLAIPSYSSQSYEVDKIIVSKSDRMLYLMNDGSVIRSYPVSLGKNPEGHKLHQGDQRTPEGRYYLDWRNADSRYHLALHISYPNAKDIESAMKKGLHPGSGIMIHGLPSKYADGEIVLMDLDWTDGCIAVSNEAIEEIWSMVHNHTVIDIIP